MSCQRFEAEALEQLQRGAALEGHFHECPDCVRAGAAYERLGAQLSQLESQAGPPPDWEARVWAQIAGRKARSRRGWWVGAALSAAAATGLAVLVWPQPAPGPQLHAVVLVRSEGTVRGAAARPGDVLRLEAAVGSAPHAALRLYRDGVLQWHCGAPDPCPGSEGRLLAEVPLTAVGHFEPVLLLSEVPIATPAAADAPLGQDLDAAQQAGARVITAPPVEVF